ncbi:MAG: AraC family transcriptional regulator [Bacteroidia bacterium]
MHIPVHSLLKSDPTGIVFRFETMSANPPKGAPLETHRHDYYEIFIFEKGGGSHFIDFSVFDIKSRNIHFVSPGQVHHLRRSKGSRGFVIMFSKEVFHLNIHDKIELIELPFFAGSQSNPLLCNEVDFETLLSLLKVMEQENKAAHNFKNEVLQSYLKIFLLKAKEIYERTRQQPAITEHVSHDVISKFKRLIELHFKEKHLVNDYAKLLNITPNHLNETCKKMLDRNAGEMIKERLVLESKRLLMHSSLSQKQIAYELNFKDPSHFSKFFKKQTNLNPQEFCESIREKYNL